VLPYRLKEQCTIRVDAYHAVGIMYCVRYCIVELNWVLALLGMFVCYVVLYIMSSLHIFMKR